MIDSLRLQRFRSYRDAAFEFEPGVNIIVGPNASGKTNLLEALLVACRGSSFRAKDSEMIAFGADWARVDTMGANSNRTVKLLRQDDDHIKKEFELDGKKLTRLNLTHTLPTVLFEPGHLLLLHGSPEARRDHLDGLLEQTVPGYTKTRRDYRRSLAQRNALLKKGGNIRGQLFAWNVRLSETGAVIASERARLVAMINEKLGDLYKRLADASHTIVSASYQPTCPLDGYGSRLLKALEDREQRDIERGFTTIGPHREDMTIDFSGRPATLTASRGETRTVLLALKIIELELIEKARDQRPLLFLDDVFSELDGKRRKALTETLRAHQTFITTTDADIVLHHFTDNCNVIPLT